MREVITEDTVEKLLNASALNIEAFLSLIRELPEDQVFSIQAATGIVKNLNLLQEDGAADEKYNYAISNILIRCSYGACKFIAPRIKGGGLKHISIILANQEISEKLFSTDLYKTLNISTILNEPISNETISKEDLNAILPVFMKSACKYTDMDQLKFIYTKYNDNFNTIAGQPEFIEFKNLLSAAVGSNFDAKFNKAGQYSQFGGIDFDGMLTLCAALAEEKPYFTPVVLNCEHSSIELKKLLEFVCDNIDYFSNNDKPIVFIAKAYHTICGAIQIINGVATISLLDSLGEKKLMADMQWDDTTRPQDIIDFARNIFAEKNITTQDKVIVNEQRQTSGLGCTMFATKDAMIISKYLTIMQENQSSTKLWQFLKSAQTSKIPEKLKQEHEQAFRSVAINKKGLTYSGFMYKYFRYNPILNKKSNYYMDDKLGKWRDKVINFLKSNTYESVRDKTDGLTLDGFCKHNKNLMSSRKPNSKPV